MLNLHTFAALSSNMVSFEGLEAAELLSSKMDSHLPV